MPHFVTNDLRYSRPNPRFCYTTVHTEHCEQNAHPVKAHQNFSTNFSSAWSSPYCFHLTQCPVTVTESQAISQVPLQPEALTLQSRYSKSIHGRRVHLSSVQALQAASGLGAAKLHRPESSFKINRLKWFTKRLSRYCYHWRTVIRSRAKADALELLGTTWAISLARPG